MQKKIPKERAASPGSRGRWGTLCARELATLTCVPELPDVALYVEHLAARLCGQRLERVRLKSPFVLRSVDPPLSATHGRRVTGVERLGKRIVIALDGDLFIVIHLMIAGRLRWREPGAALPGKLGLLAFDFPNGSVLFTEASPKKRASVHVVRGRQELAAHHRGGIEPLEASFEAFRAALQRENHTLKRALTDPRIFSGIGNAYSDEILHRARSSPVALTQKLTDAQIGALYAACQSTLREWIERLRQSAGDAFPEKVTAFHEQMAVHGRFGKPCPICSTPVQRIRYAENEVNYCPSCQTNGRLLADRSLSRLLKSDWPKSLEELEERRREQALPAESGAARAVKSAAKKSTATPRSRRASPVVPETAPKASGAPPNAERRRNRQKMR